MWDLHAVFGRLRSKKLYAKWKKYFFGQTSVKYLGHIVKAGCICADPNKAEVIHTWP